MKRGIVVLALTLCVAPTAHAAPGEPHLVQGTLEWPARLTVEPFVVVRGEDGRWYYAEVKTAKRLESTPLTAGARVAILGTEATRPHELTAIAIGSGDAAALAMALMPHAASTPGAALPPAPAPAAGSSSPGKSVKTEPSRTATIATRPEAPAATPAPPTKPAQAGPPDSTPPADAEAATAPKDSATAARESAPAKQPAAPGIETATARPVAPADASSASKSTVGGSARQAGGARWSELRGTVDAVAGHWVVVRTEEGQLTLVDFSAIRGAAATLKAGSPIVVYGTAGDQKFQAMGLVQHENRSPAKTPPTPPRR